MSKKIRIGITIGDINGIGPEVIIKALSNSNLLEQVTPIIYGSSKVMAYHKNIVKNTNFSFVSTSSAANASYNRINVVNVTEQHSNIELGKATEEAGRMAFMAMEKAVQDAKAGDLDAIVTAPINKNAMQMAGFRHIGHTEYLTESFGVEESVMTMVSTSNIIALATNHVSIEDLPSKINKDKILQKINILTESLKQDFGFERPTIAVLGLNPHAGDEGIIGTQEIEHIKPAIKDAKNRGVLVAGPYPADGFFGNSDFKKFNAILAMYHDQGLVPFKLLSFGDGVNFTAGLPIVRTSPDHGTAYSIAGKNIANEESMRKAIYLAKDLFSKRSEYLDSTKDPVKKVPKHQEEIQES